MSRIGRDDYAAPGVTVTKRRPSGLRQGAQGRTRLSLRPEVEITVDKGNVAVDVLDAVEGGRTARAYHGMTRAMLNNMVQGVTKGFEKRLEIVGVGWNAAAQGQKIVLNIGYNKPVTIEIPKGVTVQTPDHEHHHHGPGQAGRRPPRRLDPQRRPPEPYKGKGVRYKDEVVRRKAGKSFGS